MIAPARVAVHAVLRAVHTGETDLPSALAAARHQIQDSRDRALVAEISTGTLRMRNALDCVLTNLSSRALATIDPVVLDLLRAGAYQLVYLDRVPAHAVVNDTVALTRQVNKPRAVGFVNAILRRLAAAPSRTAALPDRPHLSDPIAPDSRELALDYLTTALSHPRWLVERWLDRYGFDATERWATFNNAPAPITLRVNTLTTDREALVAALDIRGVDVEPGRWSPHTLHVTGGNPLTNPASATGEYVVQDEASQLVAELVDAGRDQRVLDLCAAPGGKTVAIAGALGTHGILIASDLRSRRLALLRDTVARQRCSNTYVVQCDAREPLPFAPLFDWVLVDAPCSGLGTLQRDPDIKWRRRSEDLATMATTQGAMLDVASAVVAPGGRLVYATCSSEPEENQVVVAGFRQRASGFVVERPRPERLAALVDAEGYFQTLPHRDGLNSFFAAILRRQPSADT